MLNQLLANERRQAGLRENIVQRAAQIGLSRLTRRKRDCGAVHREQCLRGRIVIALERNHRANPVGGIVLLQRGAGLRGIGPAGVGQRESLDICLRVGGDGIAAAIELQRAVFIELVEAQSEKLHQFARVIFVGMLRRMGGLSLFTMSR